MSAAPALLAEATAAGVGLSLAGDGRVRFVGKPPPDLLARLRAHKAELVELLVAGTCRHCGSRLDHVLPGWIPFADGTAAHLACYERAEVARLRARAGNALSPEASTDEAGHTIRGGLP